MAVAVLIDHVDAVVAADELYQLVVERIGARAHVAGLDFVLALELIAAFFDRVGGGADGDQPDAGLVVRIDDGPQDVPAHGLEFVREAVHVVDVVVLALGVLGLVVVAATAREVGCCGMVGGGERAVAHAIAIDVPVPGEAAQLFQIFGGQDFAAVDGLVGIGEGIGHPVVHAQVEVGHDEDGSLEPLGEIEGILRHGEALLGGRGEEHGMLRIAVGEDGGGEKVALRGTGGEAGGWAYALHVEEDAGDFGVVAEADELAH